MPEPPSGGYFISGGYIFCAGFEARLPPTEQGGKAFADLIARVRKPGRPSARDARPEHGGEARWDRQVIKWEFCMVPEIPP